MENNDYSEQKLWNYINDFLIKAGRSVIELMLILYYALINPHTPDWAKAIILVALVYFISPVDAIPDVIPFAGFSDDAGVLSGAIATVAINITEEIRDQARKKLDELFV